ncbi:MAG TPA: glycosyltransferase [Acidimicrobiia bacterium]|nr:glycosyltransferase [Acidimicrobiia bacterium]
MWLHAPEHDYSSLSALPPPAPTLRVALCMPVYNRVDLLSRTVAALVPQTYPIELMQVVIGDDGSDEDVEGAVAAFRDRLDIRVLRRKRDGYGAGQARNLAARHAEADVLVFIDADCLPDPDLVANHADWHHKAENLVVIGSRHGLDTTDLRPDDLAAGTAGLRKLAFGTDSLDPAAVRQTDHRGVLHRRTSDQRFGDEGFRSLVSSNFSIRRDRFLEVGGFDESFHRWGGEDVELGWRCQAEGLFTVTEDSAIVFHQLQEDDWEESGREQSKELNAGVIQNKIPHSFYRKYRPDHIWEVPKASVVVWPTIPARIDELSGQLRRQSYTDWEMILQAGSPEATLFAETNSHDPRFRVVETHDRAGLLQAARGEYVALIHGDVAPEPRLLAATVRRLENQRRSNLATCGYLVGDAMYRTPEDVADLDSHWSDSGLPVFSLVRRREWAKALHALLSAGDAYGWIRTNGRPIHLTEAHLALRSIRPGPDVGEPLPAFISPTTRLRAEVAAAGLRPAALKAVARYVKRRRAPSPSPHQPLPPPPREGKPVVRYVGWTGHDNMGDEALLEAITGALDWAEVRTAKRGDLLLLGGGTLINRGSYLDWLEEQDSPRLERAVFGTGVANPDFWRDRDESRRWVDWLDTCAYVGVRGPLSAGILSDWGVANDVEVVGDAALLLDATAPRREGRVVIAPCRTRGELWGGDDKKVFGRLADLAADLGRGGHEVHMLAAHPDDDGPIIEITRRADRPDLPYLAGYADLEAALELFASADVVVAERLHAAVLAAAVGTPFVALEYRPKVRDFAASVGFEEYTVRTDDLDGLEERVRAAIADRKNLVAQLEPRVAEYRDRLRKASSRLAEVMGA